MPWAYLLLAGDDERCMRFAREIGEGLTEEELIGLSMSIAQAIQDYFSYMQSDDSDAD